MTQVKDGGPAFPQHSVTLAEDGVTLHETVTGGMSLRDYAAIHFMAAIISRQAKDYETINAMATGTKGGDLEAKAALAWADVFVLRAKDQPRD